MCATVQSALEVCLNCGVSIGPAAKMQTFARGEHACVGVIAVFGGVGILNRAIHLVLLL